MVSFRKRGGIRFLRIGRINIQWSIKRANPINRSPVSWSQPLSRTTCFCDVSGAIDHKAAQLRIERLCERSEGRF